MTGLGIHDRVDALTELVTSSYWRLVGSDPSPVSPGGCVADPAAAWVAEMAIIGRPLPVNTATEQALRTAAERLGALSQLAETVSR